jgi:hypothetical protein
MPLRLFGFQRRHVFESVLQIFLGLMTTGFHSFNYAVQGRTRVHAKDALGEQPVLTVMLSSA